MSCPHPLRCVIGAGLAPLQRRVVDLHKGDKKIHPLIPAHSFNYGFRMMSDCPSKPFQRFVNLTGIIPSDVLSEQA
jgi:hypothetical protein